METCQGCCEIVLMLLLFICTSNWWNLQIKARMPEGLPIYCYDNIRGSCAVGIVGFCRFLTFERLSMMIYWMVGLIDWLTEKKMG